MYLESTKYFKNIADIEPKATLVSGHQFPKLTVKIRNEIVVLGEKVTQEEVIKYKKEFTPEEFKKILDEGKADDYIILDMRNDYEYRLGHFKGAIPAGTVNFREVPQLLERYRSKANGKKIIWYCTGGIRCEKASAYLRQKGFKNVYQLHGGIIKYIEKHPEFGFDGHCYVFDKRISVKANDNIISECEHCGVKTARYLNCIDDICHRQYVCCEACDTEHQGYCHPSLHRAAPAVA